MTLKIVPCCAQALAGVVAATEILYVPVGVPTLVTPVPDMGNDWAAVLSPLGKLSVALTAPDAVGVKTTLTAQLELIGKLTPQVLLLIAKRADVEEIVPTDNAAVPTLVSVMEAAALGVFRVTLPKARDVEENEAIPTGGGGLDPPPQLMLVKVKAPRAITKSAPGSLRREGLRTSRTPATSEALRASQGRRLPLGFPWPF